MNGHGAAGESLKSQIKLKATQMLIYRSYAFWKSSSDCPSSLAVGMAWKLKSFTWY